MKKSTLLLWTLSLLTSLSFTGCGAGIKGLMLYDTDPTLKTITQVRALPMQSSVGFEWKKIEDSRIHGVNIYRGEPTEGSQSFKRIGSAGNRYATHFVDTHAKPNRTYLYTFTTFSLGKESKHGAVLKVKTRPSLNGVSFVKAYSVAPGVVKILWAPHTNQSINRYVIERSVNTGPWKYMTQIEGQLMAEYIDTFVYAGNNYRYRVIAKSYNDIMTKPSQVTRLAL